MINNFTSVFTATHTCTLLIHLRIRVNTSCLPCIKQVFVKHPHVLNTQPLKKINNSLGSLTNPPNRNLLYTHGTQSHYVFQMKHLKLNTHIKKKKVQNCFKKKEQSATISNRGAVILSVSSCHLYKHCRVI